MPTAPAARLDLLTDVPGLIVGNAHDQDLGSGVTIVLFEQPAVASCAILGGAPGSRETTALEPEMVVEKIDALVLSGGSAFGLDAASGVQAWLRERGRGFQVGSARVPIVPQAILFDLLNGGDKDWGRYPPYRDMAYAASNTASREFRLGSTGAGFGANTVNLRGGLGSASAVTSGGFTVAALVAVNALGSPIVGAGPHFWAAPWEEGCEYGGLGLPAVITPDMRKLAWKGGPELATTLAIVATDAILTKPEAKRLAIVAHGGFARALRLSGAAFDGDTVFAASTGRKPRSAVPASDLIEIGALAADCTARAIARGVYEASAHELSVGPPSWQQLFAKKASN